MPPGAIHVVPHGEAWGLRRGGEPVERVFGSKLAAWRNARAWAQREDIWVVVHGLDIAVRERDLEEPWLGA